MRTWKLMWHQFERSYYRKQGPNRLAPEQNEMDAFDICSSPFRDKELYPGQFCVEFDKEHDAHLEIDVAPI